MTSPHVPDDEELVAYLDGELGEEESRAVEEAVARDSALRQRVETLRKTYDLLSFLPAPPASSDFATRTVTKAFPAKTRSLPLPKKALATAAILFFALAFGWGAARLTRNSAAEELLFVDHRIIERLPLYVGVDDLAFLRKLDEAELFFQEAPPSATEGTRGERPAVHEKYLALYKTFPTARKEQLRKLDHDFHELPVAERDRLGRTLESYAIWLDRLSDGDRQAVLSKAEPEARLEEIRSLKERRHLEELPRRLKEKREATTNEEERASLLASWGNAERLRDDEWRKPPEGVAELGRPWPFDEDRLVKEIDDYLKHAYKIDWNARSEKEIPHGCRLAPSEFLELQAVRENAMRDNRWFQYGLSLHRVTSRHPYLPEPGKRVPITEPAHLPKELRQQRFLVMLGDRKGSRGKWPDFALDVVQALGKTKQSIPEALGPCVPGEFQEPVNVYLEGALKRWSEPDRAALKKLEGKWPEYPRKLLELAHKYDEPVPTVTLPGKPSQWERLYGRRK